MVKLAAKFQGTRDLPILRAGMAAKNGSVRQLYTLSRRILGAVINNILT